MYRKIINKYYLQKIFALVIPQKKKSNLVSYFFIKYLIKNSPYNNMSIFMKEIHKLINILYNKNTTKKLIFLCTNKIFFLNQQKNNQLTFITSKNLYVLDTLYALKKNNVVF